MTKLILAPFRSLLRSPLVHFVVVVFLILVLQAAPDDSDLGRIFTALDKLVSSTVDLLSGAFTVKSFTKAWLLSGIMMAYVYVCLIVAVHIARVAIRRLVDLAGRKNFLWLRTMIARERGITAYRAWLPFERIRPAHISQQQWETTFAWPPDNRAPYPSLPKRIGRAILTYALLAAAAVLAISLYRWTRS